MLEAFGATIVHRQIFNPFSQAYEDMTKGSRLAPEGKDNTHCNRAQSKHSISLTQFFDALTSSSNLQGLLSKMWCKG
jgi:hypothetical protein